ncbi:hypothetical protein P7K49_026444 [Saguinus oedipus]|uniref:Uncharacterized protein n=1 Tax=Saguinus oedipus TaxID=9490 RepID=A0ABQ9UD79_SAGOE|nr:hypothetical protein P7K49_026444 [Saguinus oedipus]
MVYSAQCSGQKEQFNQCHGKYSGVTAQLDNLDDAFLRHWLLNSLQTELQHLWLLMQSSELMFPSLDMPGDFYVDKLGPHRHVNFSASLHDNEVEAGRAVMQKFEKAPESKVVFDANAPVAVRSKVPDSEFPVMQCLTGEERRGDVHSEPSSHTNESRAIQDKQCMRLE